MKAIIAFFPLSLSYTKDYFDLIKNEFLNYLKTTKKRECGDGEKRNVFAKGRRKFSRELIKSHSHVMFIQVSLALTSFQPLQAVFRL